MIQSVLVVVSVVIVAIAQSTDGQGDIEQSTASRANVTLLHHNGQKVKSEIYNKHDGNRIVFPNEETNKKRMPTHDRTPVTDPSCGENELLYPGDNEGDWACDCKPGYLHYPLTSKCYEAYTQGPCKRDQLLILDGRGTNSIPKCVNNKCGKGMVEFQTQCFTLNEEAGCQQYKSGLSRPVILTINPTTNGLICATEDLAIECADKCCIGRNGNVVPPGIVCELPNSDVPARRPRPPTQTALQQPQPSRPQASPSRPQVSPSRPDQANSQQFAGPSQNSGQARPTFSQGSPQSQPAQARPSASFQYPTAQPPAQGIQPPHQNSQQQLQHGSGQQSQFQSQGNPSQNSQQTQSQFQNQQTQSQFQNQQTQDTDSPYLSQPTQAQISAQNQAVGHTQLSQGVVQRVEEVIQDHKEKLGPQPLTDAQKAGQRVLS